MSVMTDAMARRNDSRGTIRRTFAIGLRNDALASSLSKPLRSRFDFEVSSFHPGSVCA